MQSSCLVLLLLAPKQPKANEHVLRQITMALGQFQISLACSMVVSSMFGWGPPISQTCQKVAVVLFLSKIAMLNTRPLCLTCM
jgi:hypothetical protein